MKNIITYTILGFLFVFTWLCCVGSNVTDWNHGNCVECGNEYQTVEFIEDGTEFIRWKCENCEISGLIRALWAD